MNVINLSIKEKKIFNLVASAASELEYPAYAIGGFVRDKLLDRPSKDIDFVCVGDCAIWAQKIIDKLPSKPKLTIFKRFGTAMFKYEGFELEFVSARKESYNPDSRNPNVFPGTLEDDQNRRDFTINALAINLADSNFQEIVDPFNGISDLENGVIKTPMDPDITFSDDPLRMMRAIRFASQLGFFIEEQTLNSITKNASRIEIVAKERVVTELNKIVESKVPSVGFKLLFDTSLLKIIFMEMANLQGVDIIDGRGHKDNFYHTLEVLDNLSELSEDLWLRWSAIFHDIAKPATKRYDEKAGWTFHGHEAVGAAWVPRLFKKLGLPGDSKMKYVQKLVRLHLRPISLTNENITDSAIRRLLFDAGDDIDDLMLLCSADITSKNQTKVERYLANYKMVKEKLEELEARDKIRNWQPPISGELIMESFNINPSREVGVIKKAIREAILDGKIPNNYDAAFQFMIETGKEMGLSQVK